MNYYISDLHFGHKNALNFDERPFENVDEMARVIISAWNSKVAQDDDVYVIGDFQYRDEKSPEWYLNQLKGHKHLIIGNHDNLLIENEAVMKHFESVEKIQYVSDMLEGSRVHVVLCHFPILSWNKKMHGSYHVYGHIHANELEASRIMYQYGEGRALNAGCMINHYAPASLKELIINNERFINTIG